MLFDRFRLTDRVAVITGGGRGIGAAIALAYAEAGADIAIAARSQDQLDEIASQVEGFGRRAVVVACDLNDTSNLERLVNQTIDTLGRLDVVVNNVGGTMPAALLDTSEKMFERSFHFNVTTAFRLTQLAVPHLLDQAGGSVVNISSAIGRLTDRGFAAYGTAKGALAHLTRLLAAELAPRIRVNAIAVGATATSALDVVLEDDALREQMIDGTPLRRLGEPIDIALGALYLASPAGSYLTGKILEIDGGLEAPNLALGLPDL